MEQEKDYFAFISYKSEDVEWAIWLQHELEHYHLPTSYNGRTDLRQDLRPVFRDIDELSAGNLPEQIKHALVNSENLIVICSPQAAKSPWVNQEVEAFISLGKVNHIFPFIVEGNSPKEFFPPSLLNLPRNEERLGGEVSKNGRDSAFVKVVAGMLGVGFDSLWNRYEKEKAEEERKIREQRDKLLIMQSRFIAEKAKALIEEGDAYTARLLALEALPKDLENPNRPLVHEAEIALRQAVRQKTGIFKGHINFINSISLSPDGKCLASASQDGTIRIWDTDTGACLNILEKPSSMYKSNFEHEALDGLVACTQGFNSIAYSPDGKMIVATGCGNQINVWDTKTYRHIITLSGKDHLSSKNMASFIDRSNKLIVAGTKGEEDEYIYLFPEDYGLVLWNCKTWETERVISEKENDVNIFAVNCCNNCVACASMYGPSIRVYNFETGILINELIHKSSCPISINCISFSPNGEFLLSGGGDCRLYIWNVKTGSIVWMSELFETALQSAIYSPSGHYIACSDSKGIISIFDGYNYNIIQEINCHHDVHSIVFTLDEKGLFSAGRENEIHLWELNSCTTKKSYIPLQSLKNKTTHKYTARKKNLHIDHNAKRKLLANISTYEDADNASNYIVITLLSTKNR